MDPTAPQPLHEIVKRDGRRVPFEADKISRALFAAGEALGRADAFLARELTDGIVHFLAAEQDDEPLTTARLADLVVKIVRELGHPSLANTFAEHAGQRPREARLSAATPNASDEVVLSFPAAMPFAAVMAGSIRSYTLQAVYARDIVAACNAGLLTLTGLAHPCELQASVLKSGPYPGPGRFDLAERVEAARRLAGMYLIVDGPEYDLIEPARDLARSFAHELAFSLRATGLNAIVNLNSSPPQRAVELASGPLFAEHEGVPASVERSAVSDLLFDELLRVPGNRVRVDWHLGASDFEPNCRPRLERVARAALAGQAVAVTFDRPGRPVALAEGIDRHVTAALLSIGLVLPRLAEQSGVNGDPERFSGKLGTLARLAISAGVQKRAFLRKQARQRPAEQADAVDWDRFLIDRARLVVVPIGLDRVVRDFSGQSFVSGGPSLELARRIVGRLRDVLHQDGRATLLDTEVDALADFPSIENDYSIDSGAGLTPEDSDSVFDLQKSAAYWHSAKIAGTLKLFLPDEPPATAVEVVDWLQTAWQRSDVMRIRFVRRSLCASTLQ